VVKLLWYLLFLFMYIVATSAFGAVAAKFKRSTQTPLWLLEVTQFSAAALLYLTTLLLARYSSFLIVGFYFLSSQVAILLDAMFNATEVGREKGRYQGEVRWGAMCFALNHRQLTVLVGLVGLIGYIAFPVLAGIAYFSNAVPSENATVGVIRAALLTLFVGGMVLMLPTQVGVSFSENLSAPVRRRFFFSLSASLLPNGLLLAILLSTFNIPESKTAHSSAGFHLTYSPLMLIILAAYFVLTLLVPTVLGSMRNTRWHRQLTGEQEQALAKAIEILRTPQASSYTIEVSNLIDGLQKSRDTSVSIDKSLAFGLRLDEVKAQLDLSTVAVGTTSSPLQTIATGDNDPSMPVGQVNPSVTIAQPEDELAISPSADILNIPYYQILRRSFEDSNYYLARLNDPRFAYIDALDALVKKLHATTGDLESKRSGQARLKAAREWADNYEVERRNLVNTASAAKTNTLGAAAVSTVLTSLLTVFFTSFGNWLWAHAVLTLPK
jgi:hypothetical protein